jgi:hypothetical protein
MEVLYQLSYPGASVSLGLDTETSRCQPRNFAADRHRAKESGRREPPASLHEFP